MTEAPPGSMPPAAQRRARAWQAIGYVNAGMQLPSVDALTLLRAHAWSHDRELDDVARQVVLHELPLAHLAPDVDAPF
ncbi:MAG: uncharacterized protein JWR70_1121 [Modestobacter sp.]|nr:uncharacterized protein [Modestobacter sp.]